MTDPTRFAVLGMADVPAPKPEVSDAAEFFRAEEGSSMEKLFWS